MTSTWKVVVMLWSWMEGDVVGTRVWLTMLMSCLPISLRGFVDLLVWRGRLARGPFVVSGRRSHLARGTDAALLGDQADAFAASPLACCRSNSSQLAREYRTRRPTLMPFGP